MYLIYDAPCAITEYRYGIPIGYYVTCDDAVCADCAPSGFAQGDYSGWPEFEGWEEPIAITMDDESDSITHCRECSRVIRHDLTPDGTAYLIDSLAEQISEPGSHTADVMAQWWDAYGEDLDENTLHLLAGTFSSPAENADDSDLRDAIEHALADSGCRVFVPQEA
jgi:hypothetical protein